MSFLKNRKSPAPAQRVKESAANSRTFPTVSVRASSRRNLLLFVVVAGSLMALLLAGADMGRPARAAATQQNPTPSPTPDYSNVDDILDGRRHLLRDDDFVILEDTNISENANQVSYKFLKTVGGAITSEQPVNEVFTPGHDAKLTQVGRLWDLASDVVVSVFTHPDVEFQIFEAVAYSPTKNMSREISLWEHTSLSGEPLNGPQAIILNAMKMADFNQDGFDDLVIEYGHTGDGENAIQIVNATDVNNFAAGLTARGENVFTGKMSQDGMVTGDFNGDGRPEIIGVIPQADGNGLQIVVHTVDPKTLLISNAVSFPLTIAEGAAKVSIISAASGRFTDTPHDQLLIAYAVENRNAMVKLVDFEQGTFKPQELSIWDSGTTIYTGHQGIHDYFPLLLLRSGRFTWSSPYDQALLLRGNNKHRDAGTSSFDLDFSTLFVNPGDFSITEQGKLNRSEDGTIYDLLIGNFDRRDANPQNPGQKDRNPNLQAAIVSTDASGYTSFVDTYNLDQKAGKPQEISTYKFSNDVAGAVTFAAGDMQGRSMRLSEPIKVVINGTVQPSVVLAAPPMHVAYTSVDGGPLGVLNLSAIPTSFFSSYTVDEESSNQSSSMHTTSWSFGAKESVGASIEVGDVDEGEGGKVSDTVSAAQALKGSISNTHGTYAAHKFDISQQTGLSDQLWYSQSRFNIYIYHVIGQTVCPQAKPNCTPDEMVPLTIQFSGPDQISYETIAASQVEWYQLPWEYGNVLSYPASFFQLQQIVPDLQKLSEDVKWYTDMSTSTEKTTWTKNQNDSQSSSFSQNYSFENDFSAQLAFDIEPLASLKFSFDLDVSASFGFSNLNKSSTSLGKSKGIGLHKPGTFRAPGNYEYGVIPYIYGRTMKGGQVDNIPLTSDVATFGLLQTAFAVDPLGGPAGGWWKQAYTKFPDVALNHPNRWQVHPQPLADKRPSNCLDQGDGGQGAMDCAELSPSRPDNPWMSLFHDMRGFFISNASHPGVGPQLETAKAGDKLALQARVYNYSLVQMNPGAKVHVRFYGMVWNNSNNTPAGDSFLIGESVLPPIPPFSTADGAPLNYSLAQTTFDTSPYEDKYLVFWVVTWSLGADGKLTEELPAHGLKEIPGDLKNLVDVSKFEESYSNNVGFYRLPFYVFKKDRALLSSSNSSDDVHLDRVKVSGDSIQIGQSVEVSALLHMGATAVAGTTAIFYDGDPQRFGKAFDAEHIPYLRAGDTHEVRVYFRPQTCGFHQIFVSIGKGTRFEATSGPADVQVTCNVPQPKTPACSAVCQRSPQFYLNNINRLPAGIVNVAGGGLRSSINTRNAAQMRLALDGGSSAQDRFNQQFVATQLSLLGAPGQDQGALQSPLSCYRLDFAQVRLRNGATLSPSSSLGELISQARNAARSGDVADLRSLTAILGQLNGNDPTGQCSAGRAP